MDVTITVAASLLVLVIGALIFVRREGRPSISRDALRLMARPRNDDRGDIMRSSRVHSAATTRLIAGLLRINLLQKLEQAMWQAGIYLPVADILLMMVLMIGAGSAIGGAMWGDPIWSAALGLVMGALPIVYIRIRRKRRLKAFSTQLPFALDLIKSSIEAGHSLLRGFQVVVAEFGDPIGGEFRSVLEQSRLGLPLPRALEEMLSRVPVEDLRLLTVAVRVQSEVGSSLAQIIGRLSEIVRTRQRLAQQIKSLTAQSRMSGMVVGALPIVLLAAFSVIQPSYTHTLFHDPEGQMILKVAAVLDAMAFITIRKLLNVAY